LNYTGAIIAACGSALFAQKSISVKGRKENILLNIILRRKEMKYNEKAFPLWTGHIKNKDTSPGMDLRDYFATEAMHAFISNNKEERWTYEKIANYSYDMAEAMIKEKNKRENDNG